MALKLMFEDSTLLHVFTPCTRCYTLHHAMLHAVTRYITPCYTLLHHAMSHTVTPLLHVTSHRVTRYALYTLLHVITRCFTLHVGTPYTLLHIVTPRYTLLHVVTRCALYTLLDVVSRYTLRPVTLRYALHVVTPCCML